MEYTLTGVCACACACTRARVCVCVRVCACAHVVGVVSGWVGEWVGGWVGGRKGREAERVGGREREGGGHGSLNLDIIHKDDNNDNDTLCGCDLERSYCCAYVCSWGCCESRRAAMTG